MRLVALGRLNMDEMTTHTFPIDQARDAYKLILENPDHEPFLGVLLEYPTTDRPVERRLELGSPVGLQGRGSGVVKVGLIGGGLFAKGTILPALKKLDQVQVRAVATATGKTAQDLAKRNGCDYATTDYRELLEDKEIDLVIIATRHNLHASVAVEALRAGKHVYVEKPLALNLDELQSVARVASGSPGLLTVGFNRRFAPLVIEAKRHFVNRSTPLMAHYRINAGAVPADHWVHDPVRRGVGVSWARCATLWTCLQVPGWRSAQVGVRVLDCPPTAGTCWPTITYWWHWNLPTGRGGASSTLPWAQIVCPRRCWRSWEMAGA